MSDTKLTTLNIQVVSGVFIDVPNKQRSEIQLLSYFIL